MIRKTCLLMLPLCYGLNTAFVLNFPKTCSLARLRSPSVFVFKRFGRYGATEGGAITKVCAHVGEYMIRGSCVLISSCLGSITQDGKNKCVGLWFCMNHMWYLCLKFGRVRKYTYMFSRWQADRQAN